MARTPPRPRRRRCLCCPQLPSLHARLSPCSHQRALTRPWPWRHSPPRLPPRTPHWPRLCSCTRRVIGSSSGIRTTSTRTTVMCARTKLRGSRHQRSRTRTRSRPPALPLRRPCARTVCNSRTPSASAARARSRTRSRRACTASRTRRTWRAFEASSRQRRAEASVRVSCALAGLGAVRRALWPFRTPRGGSREPKDVRGAFPPPSRTLGVGPSPAALAHRQSRASAIGDSHRRDRGKRHAIQ